MHTETTTCLFLPLNIKRNDSTVLMTAGREGFICSTYELFTQRNHFKSWESVSVLWYMSVLLESGVRVDRVLLPLELFTNAVAGSRRSARALFFHTSARNVINISSGNICHRSTHRPSHTCMLGQTQATLSESGPEVAHHTSAEGGWSGVYAE